MGMVYAHDVRHEVKTFNLLNRDFRIEPQEADKEVFQSMVFPGDVLLISLFPHMHLRGKSFRYEATYPSGQTETLLSVPQYDFMWQHRYVLAEPTRLPAGTTVRGVAVYDNSAANLANPDPSAAVVYGKLTTDEMFHGYFDAVLLNGKSSSPNFAPYAAALVTSIGCWLAVRNLRTGRRG